MEKLQSQKKLRRAKDQLNSSKKHSYGTIVERNFEDEPCQMRMHEQGNTQSDMVIFFLQKSM